MSLSVDAPVELAPGLSFRVPGVPIGQAAVVGGGSHTTDDGRVTRKKARYQNGKDLHPWRESVAAHARVAMRRAGGEWPLPAGVPVELSCTFWLPRKPTVRRRLPTVRPDGQHLVRAIEDSLVMGGVLVDDNQITDYGPTRKRYADAQHPVGALITVRIVPEEQY